MTVRNCPMSENFHSSVYQKCFSLHAYEQTPSKKQSELFIFQDHEFADFWCSLVSEQGLGSSRRPL